ncbi:hypothetical protein LXL04_005350 [Taraxacum kok-saghyz]
MTLCWLCRRLCVEAAVEECLTWEQRVPSTSVACFTDLASQNGDFRFLHRRASISTTTLCFLRSSSAFFHRKPTSVDLVQEIVKIFISALRLLFESQSTQSIIAHQLVFESPSSAHRNRLNRFGPPISKFGKETGYKRLENG